MYIGLIHFLVITACGKGNDSDYIILKIRNNLTEAKISFLKSKMKAKTLLAEIKAAYMHIWHSMRKSKCIFSMHSIIIYLSVMEMYGHAWATYIVTYIISYIL